MSDTSPLTAGGFAPAPIYPVDPAPEDATPDDTGLDAPGPDAFEAGDNQHLLDFVQSRAMAASFGAAAGLDALVVAYGAGDPSADAATRPAAQPNSGVVVSYREPATGDVGEASPPSSTPLTTTAEPASDTAPSSSAQPPPVPDTGPHDPPPPTAPSLAYPQFLPGPDYALDDWDTVPLGLKVQRFGDSLAQSPADAAHRWLNQHPWAEVALGGSLVAGGLLLGIASDLATPLTAGLSLTGNALAASAAISGASLVQAGLGASAILGGTAVLSKAARDARGRSSGSDGNDSQQPSPRGRGSAPAAEEEGAESAGVPRAGPSPGTTEPELSAEAVPPSAPGEGNAPASGTLTPGFGASAPEPAWKSNPYLAKETPQAGVRDTGIARAKRAEVELVRKDRSGTLNWTQPEIEEIIRTGRLPGGIVGHHINDVARYPEWAGDPRNIQFLRGQRRNLEAHGGDFRNSTTGQLIDRASLIGRTTGGQ